MDRCNACDRQLIKSEEVLIAGEYFVFCKGCVRETVHRYDAEHGRLAKQLQLTML